MTVFVTIEEVYSIHDAIIERAGTNAIVRDFSLLHSAIERPKATFGGVPLYPHVFAMAAAILQSLCMNHPFTDGNKRTAWSTTKRFLWLNGYHLKAKPKDGADFMVHVDNQKPELKEIAEWLRDHSSRPTG
ncbi:type II toxin-antitoxin system death-on-curing family toxin [Candidatus Gottesmanbacteria bacterium]|nr:type II toxin-antitoxin system death-on-curing family toxin [Candidatus Gottesmanbacteria bacterium]